MESDPMNEGKEKNNKNKFCKEEKNGDTYKKN